MHWIYLITPLPELKLSTLTVIYPGDKPIRLNQNISCMGLQNYIGVQTG